MKFFTSLIFASAIFSTAAQADIKADKQSVDTACAQDAATANCGADQVGTGLLKCLHEYRAANKSAQFSDACKAALDTFWVDHKAAKESTAQQPPQQPH